MDNMAESTDTLGRIATVMSSRKLLIATLVLLLLELLLNTVLKA